MKLNLSIGLVHEPLNTKHHKSCSFLPARHHQNPYVAWAMCGFASLIRQKITYVYSIHYLVVRALVICIWCSACQNSNIPIPKPRAFPKVDFPEKKYVAFDENYCEFTFERPVYTVVEQDTTFFNERSADPCWFNLYYPAFDCRIHCSYYPVSAENSFAKLNSDAFNLAMEHNKKATFIDEVRFEKPNKVSGFIFNLEGPVATPFQFFMSDSTTHFLRGALYFNTQIRPDSLAPLYEFVKQDISHMINTFAWR